MADVFRQYNAAGTVLPRWRGYVQDGPLPADRRKVKLFTYKDASRRELVRLQREADAAVQNPEAARRRDHAARPIGEHVADYLAHLARTTKSPAHHKIAGQMLRRLVSLAGWHRLSDVTTASVESALRSLALRNGAAPTVAYLNGFIKRGKAFARWLVPDRLPADPLTNLRLGNTSRAVKRRARRAGTDAEVAGLLAELPARQHLPLCLTLLAGLRRSEAAALTWADVRLNAPVPFIQLRPEWTKNGNADAIPIHHELVGLLHVAGPGMSAAPVVRSVPDVQTIRRALERAGHAFANARGERLDHHALRHTFVTNLSRTGCTRPTRKALARHASGDVTDGYDHTSLAEMYAAVCRLPSPFGASAVASAARSGTTGEPVERLPNRGTPVAQDGCVVLRGHALSCTVSLTGGDDEGRAGLLGSAGKTHDFRPELRSGLNRVGSCDMVAAARPDTQAD